MDTEILEFLKKMDSKIDKNTIMLEDVKNKIEIMAEIQKSHMEQNEKAHNEIIKPLNDKVDVIELAVKDISQDAKDVKESIEVLKEMTGKHEVDINILKRKPV